MSKDIDLKPCPFCDGYVAEDKGYGRFKVYHSRDCFLYNRVNYLAKDASYSWNKRTGGKE